MFFSYQELRLLRHIIAAHDDLDEAIRRRYIAQKINHKSVIGAYDIRIRELQKEIWQLEAYLPN